MARRLVFFPTFLTQLVKVASVSAHHIRLLTLTHLTYTCVDVTFSIVSNINLTGVNPSITTECKSLIHRMWWSCTESRRPTVWTNTSLECFRAVALIVFFFFHFSFVCILCSVSVSSQPVNAYQKGSYPRDKMSVFFKKNLSLSSLENHSNSPDFPLTLKTWEKLLIFTSISPALGTPGWECVCWVKLH